MASNWFYAAGNRQVGPIPERDLDALADSGAITRQTLVWREGLANWTPYEVARSDRAAAVAAGPPAFAGVADAAAPTAAADTPAQATRFCTQCGRPTPERELAQFGDRLVCANCKPAFAHQLREHGLTPTRYRYAGFWIRFVARILDGILLYIVILPVTFLVVGMRAFDPSRQDFDTGFLIAQIFLFIFNLTLATAYEVVFLARFGATPGKMAVGKKVINADGSPLSYGKALARFLSTIISNLTLGIGYIMAGIDEEKRALHDRICDTRVVAK